jgi:hypothetical protein
MLPQSPDLKVSVDVSGKVKPDTIETRSLDEHSEQAASFVANLSVKGVRHG